MLSRLVRYREALISLVLTSLLFCVGHLLHHYAYTKETVVVDMAPFFEVRLLTGLGNLANSLGILCWISALLILLRSLMRKHLSRRPLLKW